MGGVGITPVRSMILQSLHDKTGHSVCLLYSNTNPEDAAYAEELMNLDVPNHQVVCTMTGGRGGTPDPNWKGENCLIDWKMVERYVENPLDKTYYVVGPPGFMKAMIAMIREAGVEFSQVKLESFGGYDIPKD